ncbi:MAG TPA: sensor domain-containing diguanylate cyclase, partial [Sphaerochaeta sp.]|nr:sensor domain-containing diguanylate cyclase [Sphaerochaeta sp.]
MGEDKKLLINFENLVANLADGVYFADPEGMIMYANLGLAQILGHEEPSCMIGKSLYDFLNGENAEKVREFYAHDSPEKLGASRFEVQIIHSDGSLVWVEVRPTLKIPKTCPKGSFGVVRDITAFKHLEARLHNLAITDDLTGLYNRRGFRLMAEQELKHAQRLNAETILLSIDVDDFKSINDTFGHDEGDKVLKLVAVTLNESFRMTDIVSRWGGDEFLVLALDAPSGFVPLLSDRFQQNLAKNVQREL